MNQKEARREGRSLVFPDESGFMLQPVVRGTWAARVGGAIEFEWLPPYAPELNPAEQVWTHTKYADLANFIPEDLAHLRSEVAASISDQRSTPRLLRSFFDHAQLRL